MKRRAKIVATIGPASNSIKRIKELVAAGMDVARLNFSHGDHADHIQVIERIRKVSKETGCAITILQDIRGPKLRTGHIDSPEPIKLRQGDLLTLTTQPRLGTREHIHVNYAALTKDVKPDDRILLDDGRIELRVTAVDDTDVHTQVVVGGKLSSNKGINLPGVQLSMPALTSKDEADIALGMECGVDAVAMSFVRRPEDIHALRDVITKHAPEKKNLPIIAKLERPEAIEHLDEIMQACSGVMVARGDLGVEISPERVPSLQKLIIQRANAASKVVITATQMLESMMDNPRPTRAEASDVANAVFDGSDALMLSGETAIGKFPIASVQTMCRIIIDAEEHAPEWGRQLTDEAITTQDDAVATTRAACELADERNVSAISVFTRSGRTALLMSKERPKAPILAFTPEESTYHRLALLWGVVPYLGPMAHSVEEMIDRVRQASLASEMVAHGEQVVIVASLPVGAMGPPNFILLTTVT
jgi:pyruvate kinase